MTKLTLKAETSGQQQRCCFHRGTGVLLLPRMPFVLFQPGANGFDYADNQIQNDQDDYFIDQFHI